MSKLYYFSIEGDKSGLLFPFDLEEHDNQMRHKVIDEVYNIVTEQMIKHNTELDFNLETQNKILDLKYGESNGRD